MSAGSLEERVSALEAQVSNELLRRNGDRPKDWRRTVGMFTGDEIMRRICENALEYRAEDRQRSLAEFDAQAGESK
jgi:hypothetical protein